MEIGGCLKNGWFEETGSAERRKKNQIHQSIKEKDYKTFRMLKKEMNMRSMNCPCEKTFSDVLC